MKNKAKIAAIAAIIFYILVHLFYLDKYPLIWLDDAHHTELSWSIIKYGNFSCRMSNPNFGLEKSNVVFGRIYILSNTFFIKLFGLGPFQARIFPFISGLLLLLLTYLVTKRVLNNKSAVFSVLFLAFSYPFVLRSHTARSDIVVSMFIMLTMYLFFRALDRKSVFLFFLAGLVSALTIDIHPPGVMAVFILSALGLYHFRQLNLKTAVFVCLGISAGVAWWVSWHILPDNHLFFFQMNDYWSGLERSPLYNASIFHVFARETKRYFAFFWQGRFHRNMFFAALFIISIIRSIKQSTPGHKIFLLVLFTGMLCFTFIVPNKTDFYLIYIYPFFCILAADAMYGMLKSPGRLGKMLGAALLAGTLLLYCAENSYILAKFYGADYNGYIKKLKVYIPEDSAPVIGQPMNWFGFIQNHPYYTDYFGYYLHINKTDNSAVMDIRPVELINKNKIKYIILDDGFFYWDKNILGREILPFINSHCQLAGTVEDKYYGRGDFAFINQDRCITKIYRVN